MLVCQGVCAAGTMRVLLLEVAGQCVVLVLVHAWC